MNKLKLIAGLLLTVYWAGPVSAHHSFSATFTTDEITVEGVVKDFRYRNPHAMIYFDVTDENGELTSWRSEGAAANLLRNRGWASDEIKPGDVVRITGNSTRDGSPMISQGEVVILDAVGGDVIRVAGESASAAPAETVEVPQLALTLPDGRPNFTGAWTMGPIGGNGGGGRGMGMGMGMGMGPPGAGNNPVFNEAGAALQAKFDPANDPQVFCEPPGLVRQAGFTPHPVMVRQESDRVVLTYEEYGGERVIMIGGERPEPGELSRFGDNYAYYQDDTLVIETINLLGNPSNPQGNWLSDKVSTVETIRRMDDPALGPKLTSEMVITDPDYLEEPWVLSWEKWYNPGYEPIPNDCQPPMREGNY